MDRIVYGDHGYSTVKWGNLECLGSSEWVFRYFKSKTVDKASPLLTTPIYGDSTIVYDMIAPTFCMTSSVLRVPKAIDSRLPPVTLSMVECSPFVCVVQFVCGCLTDFMFHMFQEKVSERMEMV